MQNLIKEDREWCRTREETRREKNNKFSDIQKLCLVLLVKYVNNEHKYPIRIKSTNQQGN